MNNSLKLSTPLVSKGIHLSKHNQQLVDDFLNSLPLIKAKRRAKYISKLAAMGEDLGDFEKVTRVKLRKYIETIDAAEDLKLWTKRDYKLVAKKFFKWLHNHEFVDWIRLGRIKTTVSPEDIFTESELSRMREACSFKQRSSIRDKAIIEVLYESAMRPHEFLNLKKNNVTFDDYGAQLHVERGKTGPRIVRVINAAPLLANWIENHPLREKDSALWVDLSMNTKFEQLTWHGLDRLLERLAKIARIEKVVNSYTFRHTRLTNLANFMTEAQLCEFAGWEQGSDKTGTLLRIVNPQNPIHKEPYNRVLSFSIIDLTASALIVTASSGKLSS